MMKTYKENNKTYRFLVTILQIYIYVYIAYIFYIYTLYIIIFFIQLDA